MASTKKGGRAERGQAALPAIVLILATLTCSMLAVDIGMLWLGHTRQTDMLQQSEAACMQPAVSLKVKNSSTPGREMCAALVDQLRASGFNGAIEAYYYELGPADGVTDGSVRPYAVGATISGTSQTIFGKLAGITMPDVRSRTWTHAKFYSSDKAWRPATGSNGRLTVAAGRSAATGTWTSCASPSESVMPGVTDALRKARNTR